MFLGRPIFVCHQPSSRFASADKKETLDRKLYRRVARSVGIRWFAVATIVAYTLQTYKLVYLSQLSTLFRLLFGDWVSVGIGRFELYPTHYPLSTVSSLGLKTPRNHQRLILPLLSRRLRALGGWRRPWNTATRRALKDEEVWTTQQQPTPASRLPLLRVRQEVAQRMVAPDPAERPSCRELWNAMCVPDVHPLVPFATFDSTGVWWFSRSADGSGSAEKRRHHCTATATVGRSRNCAQPSSVAMDDEWFFVTCNIQRANKQANVVVMNQ